MEDEVKKEALERTTRCMDRINAILEEENCTLEPKIILIGNKVINPEVVVFSKPPKKETPVEGGSV